MNETHGQGASTDRADIAADAATAEADGIDGLGFDRVLERLRGVVERLETGNLSLEDSLRVYEEGVALARRGHALLDGAEKRVELLVRGPRGQAATAPLEPGTGEPEPF